VATLTTTINRDAPAGSRIKVTWTMGTPKQRYQKSFEGRGLFVRLLSASGGASTTAPAHGGAGRYTATVAVPRGGIRDIQIGIHGWSDGPAGRHPAPALFPVMNNPFHP
jgi:hypothetical protein